MELVGFVNRTFCHNESDASPPKNASGSTSSAPHSSSRTNEPQRPSSGSSDGRHNDSPDGAPQTSNLHASRSAMSVPTSESHRLELTAEFHRLNILLMRIDKISRSTPASATAAAATAAMMSGKESAFMSLDYPRQEAHKVATLTLAQAKIQASYGQESSTVEGSLGGLNLCDLTPTCGR